MTPRVSRRLSALLATAVLVCAAIAIGRVGRSIAPVDVVHAVHAIPWSRAAACMGWTALGFAALGMLESIAGRSLPEPARRPTHALRCGAIAHALCNTLGFHAVLAPAIRLVLYRRDRLGGHDVAHMLAAIAFGIGAGISITTAIAAVTSMWGAAGGAMTRFVAALLALVLWIASRVRRDRPLAGRWTRWLRGGPRLAWVGALECMCAMAALYVLLPAGESAAWPAFVLAYAAASVAGVASHAPGGLGVFEATMLALLPGDRTGVLAALVAYRVIYNISPAVIAAIAFAALTSRPSHGVSSTADTGGWRAAGRNTAAPDAGARSADARGVDSQR